LTAELTKQPAEGTQTELDDPVMEGLRSLRRLAVQLHRRAATADDHILRVIMGKREALLNSIAAHLASKAKGAENVSGKNLPPVSEMPPERRETIAKVVAEIVAMDKESEHVLRKRLSQTTEKMLKLKAGRKWRESVQKWT